MKVILFIAKHRSLLLDRKLQHAWSILVGRELLAFFWYHGRPFFRPFTAAVSDRLWMLVDDVLGAFVVLFVFSWEARAITPECMALLLLFLRLGSRHCIRRPNPKNIVVYWFLACAQDQFLTFMVNLVFKSEHPQD
jgi:hypothetical protein